MGTIEGKENNVFLIDWLAFTVPVEIDSIGKKGVEDVLNALENLDISRYFAGISQEEIAEAVVG